MAQLREATCPICLQQCTHSDLILTKHGCGHLLHFLCVLRHYPLDCPCCRTHWDHADTLAATELHRIATARGLLGQWDSSDSPHRRVVRPVVRRSLAPMDLVPLCHNHIGPPPDFLPLPERSMHYHEMNSGEDSWQCFTCGLDVPRSSIITDDTGSFFCIRHGPTANLVDVQTMQQIGHFCVRRSGTYCIVLDCEGNAGRMQVLQAVALPAPMTAPAAIIESSDEEEHAADVATISAIVDSHADEDVATIDAIVESWAS